MLYQALPCLRGKEHKAVINNLSDRRRYCTNVYLDEQYRAADISAGHKYVNG
jgi:hypothetical protein